MKILFQCGIESVLLCRHTYIIINCEGSIAQRPEVHLKTCLKLEMLIKYLDVLF